MNTKLQKPLEGYFAAVNRQDRDGMLAAFAANAVVKDEGKTRTGRVAVREWIDEVTEKYHPTIEVESATEKPEGLSVVTGLVSGTFPGSPLRLRYAFKIVSGEVAHLEIV